MKMKNEKRKLTLVFAKDYWMSHPLESCFLPLQKYTVCVNVPHRTWMLLMTTKSTTTAAARGRGCTTTLPRPPGGTSPATAKRRRSTSAAGTSPKSTVRLPTSAGGTVLCLLPCSCKQMCHCTKMCVCLWVENVNFLKNVVVVVNVTILSQQKYKIKFFRRMLGIFNCWFYNRFMLHPIGRSQWSWSLVSVTFFFFFSTFVELPL